MDKKIPESRYKRLNSGNTYFITTNIGKQNLELQLFSDHAGRDLRFVQFLNSELGQLWEAIPFDSLSKQFPSLSNKGAPGFFPIKGGIALQVLKHYLNGISDDKLRQRINTDFALQYFCFIQLKPGEHIKDKDIVGRWRRWLAHNIDYGCFQAELAKFWSPYIAQKSALLMDATCYESNLRYPQDTKLLWECCNWLWDLVDQTAKQLKIRKPRRKIKSLKKAYNLYARLKRKPKKRRISITRRLLYFLIKGINCWNQLNFSNRIILTQKQYQKLEHIRGVYEQQLQRFNDPEQKIKDRIVSIAKPYIRPIVRGKEIKRTEFGPKVHSMSVDGITFVEHYNNNAFNEGIRLYKAIELHTQYFGKCSQLGADRIYANNDNRVYCSMKGIATSFAPKGPKPKQPSSKQQLRRILNKARASVMEGTFGNEKQHYGLTKIKAKTEQTEKLWVHFGIWTASAVKIGKRMKAKKKTRPPAAA